MSFRLTVKQGHTQKWWYITNPLFLLNLQSSINKKGDNLLKTIIKLTTFVGLLLYISIASAAELFSADWMTCFMEKWNAEATELVEPLAKLDNPFSAKIGYGIYKEDAPKGVLVVETGKVTSAGAYNGEELDWDLRAKPESWTKWLKDGIGKLDMGKPAMFGGLGFEKGDYGAMMKDLSMMGPFIKSFEVMGKCPVE
jgi:putative sterol carrier protein